MEMIRVHLGIGGQGVNHRIEADILECPAWLTAVGSFFKGLIGKVAMWGCCKNEVPPELHNATGMIRSLRMN